MTHLIHSKFFLCCFIKYQSVFTSVDTITYGMWAYTIAMATFTHTESFSMLYIKFVFIINYNFFNCFKSCLMRLSILSESSLDPHCIFTRTQHCKQEFRGCAGTSCKFRETVSVHEISIYPKDIPPTLKLKTIKVS